MVRNVNSKKEEKSSFMRNSKSLLDNPKITDFFNNLDISKKEEIENEKEVQRLHN